MDGQPLKILVVDDDAFVRDMLAFILQSSAYEVETAENGVQAIQRYLADPAIGMVISDMNMPEMNGLELIQEIRKQSPEIPITILTGNNEISVAVEAIHSGANDYLLKDENIQDTILLSVEKTWEKYQLKRKNLQLMEDLAKKNEELERSNQALKELNQLKNKFLGIAAHDMRNPLTSIRGLSELLLNELFGPLLDEQKEYLTVVHTTADEMLTLLNDLLDVSVIESGRLEIQPKRGSLKRLIEDRIRLNRVVAERKSIRIHPELSDLPEIPFDASRIAQVIDNLVGNAIKFSPAGSQVYVALSQEERRIRVSVQDQGPGIPPEEQGRLFGEFQKLSTRPTGGEKSTGLGLAIVKKIVQAHGGEVGVESRVGSGATFHFTLPMEG